MAEAKPYSRIREILGNFIGKRVIDITQQDEDEFKETGEAYVSFHFDNGGIVKIEDKSIEWFDPECTIPLDLDEDGDEGGRPKLDPSLPRLPSNNSSR